MFTARKTFDVDMFTYNAVHVHTTLSFWVVPFLSITHSLGKVHHIHNISYVGG
jgi:hypothetical protein